MLLCACHASVAGNPHAACGMPSALSLGVFAAGRVMMRAPKLTPRVASHQPPRGQDRPTGHPCDKYGARRGKANVSLVVAGAQQKAARLSFSRVRQDAGARCTHSTSTPCPLRHSGSVQGAVRPGCAQGRRHQHGCHAPSTSDHHSGYPGAPQSAMPPGPLQPCVPPLPTFYAYPYSPNFL